MLRQNFGISVPGLDPLPTDESGVNVKLIYSIIRHCIKNQRKWDVEEQAILGIFSFNKFIMWNDIHNNAPKLTQNKIVSSLINGKIEWNAITEEMDASYMDRQLLRQISCCPSLPIHLSWKRFMRRCTTRLLSCTALREPESPKR